MAGKKQDKSAELNILKMEFSTIRFRVLGMMPVILNRMSEKAMRELLLPKGRRTAADRATSLKHDPYQEFLASPYIDPDPKAPTYIQHLASAFKRGMADAAMDVPGTNKTQIGRLAWVNGERLSIWGVPKMIMSVVRSADINRTPDVRTRAIIPEWAAEISVSYATPLLNATGVANLVAAAGIFQGLGDWRTGKGKGTYGQYRIVEPGDAEWDRITKTGGRKVQQKAMEEPEFYDEETEELYQWFQGEVSRRGREAETNREAPKARGRRSAKAEANGTAE